MTKGIQVLTFDLIVLVLLLFAVGCNDSNLVERPTSDLTSSFGVPCVVTYMYRTDTGKKFLIRSDAITSSLAKVVVTTEGFVKDQTYDLGELDPIAQCFLADLDGDGFQELYIITKTIGSGSYSLLFGFASNKDKSTSPIYIKEKESELMKGFMGHNVFRLKNGMLTETFPIYLEHDSNSKPTGGERNLYYELIPREAGWTLISRK